MNEQELIELFKPCEELCKDCGAICCYDQKGIKCKALIDGKCTQRNHFCLLFYCDKIKEKFPDIAYIIDKEAQRMFPECALVDVKPDFNWNNLKWTKHQES